MNIDKMIHRRAGDYVAAIHANEADMAAELVTLRVQIAQLRQALEAEKVRSSLSGTNCIMLTIELGHWHGEWKARLLGEMEWVRFHMSEENRKEAELAARYFLNIHPEQPVEFKKG